MHSLSPVPGVIGPTVAGWLPYGENRCLNQLSTEGLRHKENQQQVNRAPCLKIRVLARHRHFPQLPPEDTSGFAWLPRCHLVRVLVTQRPPSGKYFYRSHRMSHSYRAYRVSGPSAPALASS